ncbi:hypothetical protein C7212DRAFT_347240 [Tuber magnatum]|uniref:Uncharacterized protein n=1 Tax=Tuber magnatum TaxID=42249 RepID=A0A317SGA6_9PEZI|nr:hypothetical protein C7212DRAFT_347240 [Tuber magnatum]
MPLFSRSPFFILPLACSLVPQLATRLPLSQNRIYWEINNRKKSHTNLASDVNVLPVAPVSEDTWYERLQQQRRELVQETRELLQETNQQRAQELRELRQEYQALVSERQLKLDAKIQENRDLLHAVLQQKNHGLWLARNFNVRGALERIAFQATLQKMIRVNADSGVQPRLNLLAGLPKFNAILHQEVLQRGLVKSQTNTALKHIYHEVSKHAHGNDGLIVVRTTDFTPAELAVLVSFLKLQDQWQYPLQCLGYLQTGLLPILIVVEVYLP